MQAYVATYTLLLLFQYQLSLRKRELLRKRGFIHFTADVSLGVTCTWL